MPIPVRCSQCGFARSVSDEFAGRQGKCPQCGALVRVGTPAATAAKPVARAAPQPATEPKHAPKPKAKQPPSTGPQPKPVAAPEPAAPPVSDSATIYESFLQGATTSSEAGAAEPVVESAAESSWADLAATGAIKPSRSRRAGNKKTKDRGSSQAANSGATRRSRRAPGAIPLPGWAIAAILAGVLLVVGAVVYVATRGGGESVAAVTTKRSTKADSKTEQKSAVKPEKESTKMDRPEGMPTLADDKRPAADAPLEDIFAWVKPAIVVLEVFSGGQQIGMGSGFVVDASGTIVTNYHVCSAGDRAFALFTDGSRYEVAGYAAVKPEWDLAVLQLKEKPEQLRVLELEHQGKPREASKVMAVGSPLGHSFVPTSGIIGRVVQAAHLPGAARLFVRMQTGDDEQFWIEHDAKIAPGNSGGPLFNTAGNVIGVNSWVDSSVDFGYAIWSWYVYDLLNKKLPQVEPLAKYKKVLDSTGESFVEALQPEAMQKLFDELEAGNWCPADAGQFGRVQECAKLLALGRLDKVLHLPKEITAKATELCVKLASKVWKLQEQVIPLNKLAVAELKKPAAGMLLFGRVKFKQTTKTSAGAVTVLVIAVEGEPQYLAMPSSGAEAALADGTLCLVLGIVSNNTLTFITPGEGRVDAVLLEAPAVLPIKAE